MIFNNWAFKSNDFHWFFNVSSKSNEKPLKFKLIKENQTKSSKNTEEYNIPMTFNNLGPQTF